MPDNDHSKLSAEEYRRIAYGEWWQQVDIEEARPYHERNIQACAEALQYHDSPDRPINILAVHGSSRSNTELSCAHEPSNSQLLLRRGLQVLDGRTDVEIEEVNLREYKVEFCNSCYSTTSALCNFPCTCFPLDPMQELYPKVLRCDVLLISTGVNQSDKSDRLQAFCSRLISADGGYYIRIKDFAAKDDGYKNRMVATSLNQPVHYDQRLRGRVTAFFISSKDDADDLPAGDLRDELPGYVDIVAASLAKGFLDYGFYVADPWYAKFAAVVDEELSYDRMRLQLDTDAHNQAKRVTEVAVELAKTFRIEPPAPGPHPPNRT